MFHGQIGIGQFFRGGIFVLKQKVFKKNIDLAFDFKGDIRNAWFLWLTRPKISFGYNTTGGNYFFTNPMEMNQNLHQLYRAFNLVSAVGCQHNEDQKDQMGIQ